MDMTPKAGLMSEKTDKKSKHAMTIGVSVSRGARATLTPSRMPCFRVWEMTSVSMGPGDNPALSPRTIPVINRDFVF